MFAKEKFQFYPIKNIFQKKAVLLYRCNLFCYYFWNSKAQQHQLIWAHGMWAHPIICFSANQISIDFFHHSFIYLFNHRNKLFINVLKIILLEKDYRHQLDLQDNWKLLPRMFNQKQISYTFCHLIQCLESIKHIDG